MTSGDSPLLEVVPWRYKAADHPHIVPLRAFRDNYIWLLTLQPHGQARQAVVVDPGDAEPVLRALSAEGLSLAGILVTHHHADHTGGIADLKRAWPQAVVYGPLKCSNPFIERRVEHGETLTIEGWDVDCRVIEVPGHTLDHNAYFFEHLGGDPRPVLFCGDTLFAGGCGRIFEGTPELMFESLGRLAELPESTLVYCAHEYTLANLRFAQAVEPASAPASARLREAETIRQHDLATIPSTIGIELQTNPFLRVDKAPVRQTVASRSDVDVADEVAVFAFLRGWKNEFG